VSRERESRLAYSTGGEREPETAAAPELRPRGGTRLRLERRGSGRLVTVVSGLPGTDAEGAALGRELRAACGTGGTYKDGALELQGDQRERVEQLLRARGIPSKRAGG
jgi:translation initiation factor 1